MEENKRKDFLKRRSEQRLNEEKEPATPIMGKEKAILDRGQGCESADAEQLWLF